MAKKHKGGGGGHGGGASSERWLLTYADLITLLMVFFIVLYSMSQVDQKKYSAIANALASSFGIGGGNLIISTGMGTGDGVSVPLPSDLEAKLAQGDHEGVAKVLEKLGEQLNQELAAEILKDGRFTVRVAERGLILSLAGSAAFDSGKADLKPDFIPVLDAIAERLRGLPNDISVEGFTDSDPIRTAEFRSNWELSVARANRVREYLETKGLNGERMIVVGYGETRPAFSNATAEGKAKNRRVDVVILTDRQVLDLGKEITKP